MNVKWTSHLPSESQEKEEFRQLVLASKPVLDRLIDILTQDCDAYDAEQLDFAAYDSVNWPLKQADLIATKRSLRKVVALCKI